MTPDWRLAVVLVVLVALGVTASWVGDLGVGRDQVTAAVRAVLQLAVVSLVIATALQSVWLSLAFVLLMFVVATWTSGGRLDVPRGQLPWVAAAIAAGLLPVLALVLASGVVPFNGPGILPIAGIVVGNTMTAASLTGRRAFDELTAQSGSLRGRSGAGPDQSAGGARGGAADGAGGAHAGVGPDPYRRPGDAPRRLRRRAARRRHAAGGRRRAGPRADGPDGRPGGDRGRAAAPGGDAPVLVRRDLAGVYPR